MAVRRGQEQACLSGGGQSSAGAPSERWLLHDESVAMAVEAAGVLCAALETCEWAERMRLEVKRGYSAARITPLRASQLTDTSLAVVRVHYLHTRAFPENDRRSNSIRRKDCWMMAWSTAQISSYPTQCQDVGNLESDIRFRVWAMVSAFHQTRRAAVFEEKAPTAQQKWMTLVWTVRRLTLFDTSLAARVSCTNGINALAPAEFINLVSV